MLKDSPLVHFFGEFGCLNYCVLAHVEERQPSFVISTQPDYLKLMQMKCDKIRPSAEGHVYRANCKGSGFGFSVDHSHIDFLCKSGYMSLKDYFYFDTGRCINHLKLLREPLFCDIGLTDSYIGVSFRNRTHEKQRNLKETHWTEILEIIRRYSDLEIIAHGMSIDTLSSDHFGIRHVDTIEESIAYMNRTKVFIGSMSGISQFASNCACPVIQVGDVSRHFDYDPFEQGCIAVPPEDFERAFVSLYFK